MQEATPNNLQEFHRLFRAFRSHDAMGYWFRGHSDSSWDLSPKAGRKEYYLPSNRDLGRFNDWCNHAIAYYDLPDSKIERLAIAQHHGLATRLLDWTRNPLVAAFFSCIENPDIEGAIHIISIPERLISENVDWEFLKTTSGILGYIPKSISPRLLQQQGLFTVHCDSSHKIEPHNAQDTSDVLKRIKILIKKDLKAELLQMLDDYGINRATLFPDIDGLSKHINLKTSLMIK